MGVTIIFNAGKYEPAALAALIASKFGTAAAFKVCNREILIAETLKRLDDLQYWHKVRVTVESTGGPLELRTPSPALETPPEEGLNLINIFSRIANPVSRRRVLKSAVSLLRHDPIE